ncbi:LysM peptidoglycan-binding domain-containing protein [Gynuella sp.]|uniref:LysM peptidoglycan-binding domain-containing protein n=1 Tax=Gynuella sp. TaxID=2969146 RepID=UPI003D10C568
MTGPYFPWDDDDSRQDSLTDSCSPNNDEEISTRPEGYQRIDEYRLPAPVRDFVRKQGFGHYWQQREVNRMQWAGEPAPAGIVLVIFDGRSARRVDRYQQTQHGHQQLYVFRKPGAFKQTRGIGGSASTGRYEQYDAESAQILQSLDTARPVKLELTNLAWHQRQYRFEEEALRGWFSIAHLAGHEGKQLNVIVKGDNDEQGRRIVSQFFVTLKAEQYRYEFEVPGLKADDVFDPAVGDLRFSVKGLLGEGKFSGPATMIKPTQLTIQQIADQLKQIEQNRGYEQARYAAKQLDYDAMCKLVHHRDLADNDPNLMPSRFMLLPGASDEQLEAQGNLDAFPWSVHEDGPQYFSVAFLKQCLQLSGHYQSDEPLPRWSSEVDDQAVDEHEHPIHPANTFADDDSVDRQPNELKAEFDDALQQAYTQYLSEHGVKKVLKAYQPKSEGRYIVQPGDSLHSIADTQGYPYWTLLWEANRSELESPDLLAAETELILPELNADELLEWLTEQGEQTLYWSQKGFFFPANYVSYSLLDDDQQPLSGLDSSPEWIAAQRTTDQYRFYHFSLTHHDACYLMMPNDQNLVLGLVRGQLSSTGQALRRILPPLWNGSENDPAAAVDLTESLFFDDDPDYHSV